VNSLHPLRNVKALLSASGDDPFVRAEADQKRILHAWRTDRGAVGWLIPSRRVAGRGHVVAVGPAVAAAELLRAALDVGVDASSVTLPRDADRHLPEHRLETRNDWEWFFIRTPPAAVPHEDRAVVLERPHWPEVTELLDRASPRHDVRPGETGVLRWVGIRDGSGRLAAVAAHAEHVKGVPHLASIATAPEHRQQGLGAAVTAAITRRCLAEGRTPVTLGMYSDNEAARRVYLRLGFHREHEFTSGRLLRR
jgi:RimJ/RimL family protein N-acetyltransferase